MQPMYHNYDHDTVVEAKKKLMFYKALVVASFNLFYQLHSRGKGLLIIGVFCIAFILKFEKFMLLFWDNITKILPHTQESFFS